MTKEHDELLKRAEALEKKVDGLKEQLALTVKVNEAHEGHGAELAMENARLKKGGSGDPLLEAFKPFVQEVQKMVAEHRTSATAGVAETTAVTLERGETKVHYTKSHREEKYTDRELSGKILEVIDEGTPGKLWLAGEIASKVNEHWGIDTNSSGVGEAARALCEAQVLGKKIDARAKKTWYFLPRGVGLEKLP